MAKPRAGTARPAGDATNGGRQTEALSETPFSMQVGAVSLASGLVLEAHELADLIEEFQLGVGNEPCNRR